MKLENNKLKVFIGSGESSLVERKVLLHSIRKTSDLSKIELIVYNGTHDTLEFENGRIEKVDTPLEIKYENVTEFSNFRWFIPSICNFEGRAIYIDSDMVCISDIAIFQTHDLNGATILAKPEGYPSTGESTWGLSMCVFDCHKYQLNPSVLFEDVNQEKYSYTDLHQMTPKFLRHHPISIGALPPHWNDFDKLSGQTKLIHYTNLHTQPWKTRGHEHQEFWEAHLVDAIEAGVVSEKDINLQIMRGTARPSLLEKGDKNDCEPTLRQSLQFLASALNRKLRN